MRYARIPAALAFLASLSVGLSAWGADPPASPIRLPVIVAESQPPKPMPADATVKLTPDVSYVIQAEVECLLFPSPGGAIDITKKAGPVELRGVFVGGTGKKEWKKFDAKFVYVVDAVKDGRDELIVVPIGAKSEADAKRVTFQVGQLPIPPPKPDDPKPDDPPGPVSSFRVIFILESGQTLTAAQTNVLYGNVVEEYLNAKCTGGKAGWRRRDKDLGGENDQTMAAMWSAVKPKITTTPAVAVEVNGKVEIIVLEPTPAAMVAKFKSYKGE